MHADSIDPKLDDYLISNDGSDNTGEAAVTDAFDGADTAAAGAVAGGTPGPLVADHGLFAAQSAAAIATQSAASASSSVPSSAEETAQTWPGGSPGATVTNTTTDYVGQAGTQGDDRVDTGGDRGGGMGTIAGGVGVSPAAALLQNPSLAAVGRIPSDPVLAMQMGARMALTGQLLLLAPQGYGGESHVPWRTSSTLFVWVSQLLCVLSCFPDLSVTDAMAPVLCTGNLNLIPFGLAAGAEGNAGDRDGRNTAAAAAKVQVRPPLSAPPLSSPAPAEAGAAEAATNSAAHLPAAPNPVPPPGVLPAWTGLPHPPMWLKREENDKGHASFPPAYPNPASNFAGGGAVWPGAGGQASGRGGAASAWNEGNVGKKRPR